MKAVFLQTAINKPWTSLPQNAVKAKRIFKEAQKIHPKPNA